MLAKEWEPQGPLISHASRKPLMLSDGDIMHTIDKARRDEVQDAACGVGHPLPPPFRSLLLGSIFIPLPLHPWLFAAGARVRGACCMRDTCPV